jgi:hypothetical protein
VATKEENMQLKITVAATLVLTLLVLVPGARADPIRAPSQPRLGHWAGSPWAVDNDGGTIHAYHPWDDDWDGKKMEVARTRWSHESPIGSEAKFRSGDESALPWPGSLTRPGSEKAGQGTWIFSGSLPSPRMWPEDSTPRVRSDVASIPEPSGPALLGIGLLALGIVLRRRFIA